MEQGGVEGKIHLVDASLCASFTAGFFFSKHPGKHRGRNRAEQRRSEGQRTLRERRKEGLEGGGGAE